MDRGAWEGLVGRTVVGVIRADIRDAEVVHLCFSDGTGFAP